MIVNLSLNIQTEADPPTAAVGVELDGVHLGTREDIHPQDWGQVLGAVTAVAGPEMGSRMLDGLRTEVGRVLVAMQSKIDADDALQAKRRQTVAAFQAAAEMLTPPAPPPA